MITIAPLFFPPAVRHLIGRSPFFFFFVQAEYLGEDGEWYFYYTGQEGATFNLTHVFYATEHDRVNIAKIQKVGGGFVCTRGRAACVVYV